MFLAIVLLSLDLAVPDELFLVANRRIGGTELDTENLKNREKKRENKKKERKKKKKKGGKKKKEKKKK